MKTVFQQPANALVGAIMALYFVSANAETSPEPRAKGDSSSSQSSAAFISTHSASGVVRVRDWKTLRDDRIVKQRFDFSCGAAALATLLTYHYGKVVSEAEILSALAEVDSTTRANFDEMAEILPQFGFKAQGYAANFEQLSRAKIPVILYVKIRDYEHFTVLRGINQNTVWLADPSLGNRTFSRAQFEKFWNTRDDPLAGKFLAVVPIDAGVNVQDFFTRSPQRQTANAIEQLAAQQTRR